MSGLPQIDTGRPPRYSRPDPPREADPWGLVAFFISMAAFAVALLAIWLVSRQPSPDESREMLREAARIVDRLNR